MFNSHVCLLHTQTSPHPLQIIFDDIAFSRSHVQVLDWPAELIYFVSLITVHYLHRQIAGISNIFLIAIIT